MDECSQCGKPIKMVEGRRPRLYCSNGCRQKAFQAKRKTQKAEISLPADYVAVEKVGFQKDGKGVPIEIPTGLKGIALSIWKAEQREKKK